VVKDGLGLLLFLGFYYFVLLSPYFLSDPEMYIEANPLVSPLHIVPELYFLFAYAMLRAQPIKVAGVLLLVSRLVVPALLGLLVLRMSSLRVVLRLLVWFFISNVVLLSWLGQCSVEEPYTFFRMISTSLYFVLLVCVSLVHLFCEWLYSAH